MVHSLTSASEAIAIISQGGLALFDSFDAQHSDWEFVLAISFGFYGYDLLLAAFTPLPGRATIILHHL